MVNDYKPDFSYTFFDRPRNVNYIQFTIILDQGGRAQL